MFSKVFISNFFLDEYENPVSHYKFSTRAALDFDSFVSFNDISIREYKNFTWKTCILI